MPVFAASEFLGTLGIIMVATPFILLWGAAVLDVIRAHQSGWALVGWLLAILCLPIVGPLLYFGFRKPPTLSDADVERLYHNQREVGRSTPPMGGTRVY